MNKYHYNMRVILTLIIAIVEFSSCNTQRGNYVKQNYEPYTEHQYLIRPVNDTLLAYLFKTTIPKEKIINFNEGKIIIELTIDTAGNVNAVVFNRIDNMILNEKTQVILVAKIKDKIKYEVDNDAKNYYAILGNPIRINHIILMKNLISLVRTLAQYHRFCTICHFLKLQNILTLTTKCKNSELKSQHISN